MKRKLFLLLSIISMAVFFSRCYYDEEVTFAGLPQNVSLKNDVIPIFNANCNTSGCHDAIRSHNPGLASEIAYKDLTDGQFVNTVDPAKSNLYLQIESGSMPPSGPLSVNDQKIILAWITEGAKNN